MSPLSQTKMNFKSEEGEKDWERKEITKVRTEMITSVHQPMPGCFLPNETGTKFFPYY